VPSDAGNGAADAAVSPDTMPGPDAAPAPPSNAVANVFVGGGSSSNIVGFRLTPNGMFTRVGTTPSSGNVGYIAVDLPRKRLFAVGGANVTAFTMDTDRGTLSRIGSGSPGMGHGDVHVSVHPSGKWLFSANYGGGTVAVIPVAENGQPGRATDSKSAGRWAHGITPHPNGRFVYVPCRGANHVAQYRFDDQAGRLTPLSPPTVSQGVGPRHIAVHPTKPWAYLVTEDNGSVVSYMIDGEGRLTQPQVTRMRDGENWGAHIVVSSDGRFVFASARRTNHILAYTIDQNTGRLTQADAVNQGIAVPRDFAIDPAGRFLAVANESAGNVVIFRIDQATGKLTRIATESAVGRAQAVGIAP
jgi:6-phosphogluconolactonase (cycloisomerase 2 family)